MSLSDIKNSEPILRAVREFDRLGRDEFLARHRFGKSRKYFLIVEGRRYDAKSIVGVAHGFAVPSEGQLNHTEFTSGELTVRKKLKDLGFEVLVTERDESNKSLGADAPSRWWKGKREESYWLETTDRKDIGVDLNAPQTDESGLEHWSYSFVKVVNDGDIVFHYKTDEQCVLGWSRASGSHWTDEVVWSSHAVGSRGVVKPYRRPGLRLGLEGPYLFSNPIRLSDLRAREDAIRSLRDELRRKYPRSTLYFPFELSSKRALRPTQFYLTKLPAALAQMLPQLRAVVNEAAPHGRRSKVSEARRSGAPTGLQIGNPYVEADENSAVSERDPFTVDPNVVDRGKRGHARTQNALARHLRTIGLEPRSPRVGEPQFDVAWDADGVTYVAEVKSLTTRNEEQQLRLGLGQMLHYRHLLARRGRDVRAVLAVERQPSDRGWMTLCKELGIRLVWPSIMSKEL